MKKTLLLFLFLIPIFVSAKNVGKGIGKITFTGNQHGIVELDLPLKYFNGDDSAFASVDFNDSQWQQTFPDSDSFLLLNVKNFEGLCWFRLNFEIPDSLMSVPLALKVWQFGASEVYLDGKLLHKFGAVGTDEESEKSAFQMIPVPVAFMFSKIKQHVFAIRYSNYNLNDLETKHSKPYAAFRITIHEINDAIEDAADFSDMVPFVFMSAIFLALGLMHLILFLFLRERKQNLYYSLYSLGLFVVIFSIYYLSHGSSINALKIISEAMIFCLPVVAVSLIALLHSIFYERMLKIFWIIFYCTLYYCLGSLIHLPLYKVAAVVIFCLSGFELIRVVIKGVRNRREGAKIFAFGVLFIPIVIIVIVVISALGDNLNLPYQDFVEDNLYPVLGFAAVFSISFSMTIYLARDFAKTNKRLKVQVKAIQDLSEKSIRQESEKKKILEEQNEQLEMKVEERTSVVLKQKHLIEIKNREITDNLNYAKRIQSAILPDIKLIYKTLEDSFILFLPKDIVSGDFYTFSQKDDSVIIAAADCTGHGVAGAFMSMIGSSLLNQIINERGITQPNEILNQLNVAVIDALKQTENESNDGMDVAICKLDLKNNQLQFAGANRPLWMVRNNEATAIIPDKAPIGGMQIKRNESFTNHNIQLNKGDTIYLFSDGYADQFGGNRGKKLMSKKFRELLLSIQHLNMREQETFLQNYIEEWRGYIEQLDDILVIGIRV